MTFILIWGLTCFLVFFAIKIAELEPVISQFFCSFVFSLLIVATSSLIIQGLEISNSDKRDLVFLMEKDEDVRKEVAYFLSRKPVISKYDYSIIVSPERRKILDGMSLNSQGGTKKDDE